MKSTKLVAMMLALSLFACRSGGDDDGDDDDNGDGGSADDTAIQDIQSEEMTEGTAVTPRGVVIVAIDSFGDDPDPRIFVMEPEGGPFSGVMVFLRDGSVEGLAVGDLVDVEGGVKDEFALPDLDPSGRTVTEISPAEGGAITITKTGTADLPAPAVVLPWELAADDGEAEKWEGVLVSFENVRVNIGLAQVGDDATRQRMDVTGPFQVQSDLTEFSDIEQGDCYASITGVGDYFITYKILPRSADDLVVGDDGDCLPAETSDELCGDDADNDYNGFADCEDFSCADAAVACPTTETSVADIQSGKVKPDTTVSLSQVIVTGVSFDNPNGSLQNRTFWVQDVAASGENSGVAVFWPEDDAGELPEEIVVGRTLDLQATVDEFPCLDDACADAPVTQLGFATASNFGDVVPLDDLVPVESLDLATLAADPDSEPYEGVLVRLENVAVANPALGTNDFTIGDGTVELVVDDVIFRYRAESEVTAGQCLSSVVGILHRDIFGDNDNVPILLPRSIDDVDATPGTCP